ncbi:hypothetical protein GGR56DRAFT_652997 [Xylariaceae sp. FL0804]|nr:hypothetical protein GGR56DRAFT_652997 [Xylariaceae sp. FL0804]
MVSSEIVVEPEIVDGAPVEAPDKEALIQRNPHRDFAAVEAGRPDFDHSGRWTFSKTPNPGWKPGDGASSGDEWKRHRSVAIDPYEEGRPAVKNYKLMISATVPRPIALVSTVAADGRTRNVAPFSYFQCVTNDPPLYSLCFTGAEMNDTLTNILATEECVISMTTEAIVEAANFTSVNTPPHVSEWELSGLTPAASDLVRPPRVAESPYSVECRLHSHQHFHSKADPARPRRATMVIVEIVRFHVWADALGEDRATFDSGAARPVYRAGGITYGSCFPVFELPRPDAFREVRRDARVERILAAQGTAAAATEEGDGQKKET